MSPVTAAEKETSGFKTKNCQPVIEEMKAFEEGMIHIMQNIEFKDTNCQFQQDLNNNIVSVKNDDRLFVKADKSTNYYKLDTTEYNQLLHANVTKTYKKANKQKLSKINEEAKTITEKLNMSNRVESMATKEALTTLKDRKENFARKPTCRLINPSKSEIGSISKKILVEINRKLVNARKVNQWKNTSSVLQLCKQLTNKRDSALICFDVVEFHLSITEKLVTRALYFAFQHATISAEDRKTIIDPKQSLLFNNGQPSEKRTSFTLFDVTMGSYDGAGHVS